MHRYSNRYMITFHQSCAERLINFYPHQRGNSVPIFLKLKEDPPEAKISSLRLYLKRYQTLADADLDLKMETIEPSFQAYLFELTRKVQCQRSEAIQPSQTLCVDALLSTGNPQDLA